MDSILTSIKKLLGPTEDHTYFDPDIIIHINSALMVLTQLGVGPPEGFSITDDTAVWSDFVPDGRIEMVKSYVYMKVKLVFDPPAASMAAVMEQQIKEFEWRLNVAVD